MNAPDSANMVETRTVLFPVDQPRSATPIAEAPRASTQSLVIDVSSTCAEPTYLVAATLATLYRYTRQQPLSVDVLTPKLPGQAYGALTALLADHETLTELSSRLLDLFRPESGNVHPSNVLISINAAPEQIAAVSKGRELHYRFETQDGRCNLSVDYLPRLLTEASAQRLAGSLRAALVAADQKPMLRISELPLLDEQQLAEVLASQGTHTAHWATTLVHDYFQQYARQHPQALVATSLARGLTYGEADRLSSQLAHYLVAHGVGRDVPVAVCVRPSVDIIVALMAIYRAGGMYLPLDPTHPPALIAQMLTEASPPVVLSHATVGELPLASSTVRFNLDTDLASLQTLPESPPAVQVQLEDGAYLIYTSGTTGKPKGVIATHGNLLLYLLSARDRYRWQADDVFCSIARFTFSISLFDLLSPLCVGARVHLVSREEVLAPQQLCQALQQVTVTHMGPSLLSSLCRYLRNTPDAAQTFPRMRHASTGGDLVSPTVMKDMQGMFPGAELFVIYGCTEISCMGTTYFIERGTDVNCNYVGKPFANVVVRVLDENFNVVPFGVVGEICFAGAGVTRGYLDRPELMAERYPMIAGQRYYRTGDLGRLHADGNLEILGRNDFQVQLRGMRIEPAGIENLVRSLRLANECVTVLKQVGPNDERLVCYVVAPAIELSALRQRLADHLPEYMVPQHVLQLEALPVTTNGKIDRRKLAEMPLPMAEPKPNDIDYANDQERIIAGIMAKLIGVPQVGPEDDFFELGGHSLLAVVAIHEISQQCKVDLPAQALFQSGTPRALVARLAANTERVQTRPILLNSPVPGAKLFMLGGIHVYRELARQLEGQCSAYGVFAEHEVGMYDMNAGDYSVPQLARDYLTILKREQPQGPYFLLGYSFTGIVAFEVAQQLRAEGQRVGFLALVDAMLPEWHLGWRFRVSQIGRALSVSPRVLFDYLLWRSRAKGAGEDDQDNYRVLGRNPQMRPQDRDLLDPLDTVRIELNARTSGEYLRKQIHDYPDEVALIMSSHRLRNDPLKSSSGGWSLYLKRYQICNVDTDHMHMLKTMPYVKQTADFIVSGIRRQQ